MNEVEPATFIRGSPIEEGTEGSEGSADWDGWARRRCGLAGRDRNILDRRQHVLDDGLLLLALAGSEKIVGGLPRGRFAQLGLGRKRRREGKDIAEG